MKSRMYHRILAVTLTAAMTMTSLPAVAMEEITDDVSEVMSSTQINDSPEDVAPNEGVSNTSENEDASSQESNASENTQSESPVENASAEQATPTTEQAQPEQAQPEQAQPEQAQPEQAQPEQQQSEMMETEGVPIRSAQDLQDINNNLSGSYYLTQDIDLTGVSFTPIGNEYAPFTGTFDGNGHKVTNLTLDNKDAVYQGLFGYVENGTIKNVGVTGYIKAYGETGGIAGWVEGGTIENCYNEATIQGIYDADIGGVAGYMEGNMSNCYNIGTISCYSAGTGGVVGYMEGNMSNCYNIGTISCDVYSYIGGVAGIMNGSMSNCYNTGAVTGDPYVGGIVGFINGSMSNCYNTGVVTGYTVMGGVTGCICEDTIISNCYNTGEVSTTSSSYNCAGGVVGISLGNVSNCYNAGAVPCFDSPDRYIYIGGVVGIAATGYSIINNSYYNIDYTANAVGIGSTAGNNVLGLTTEQMTGSNALENMVFTSEAGTWVTLENATELDENNLYYGYVPQLSVFVADPKNPQPEEMSSTTLTEIVDLANGSITLSNHDERIEITQGDDTHYIAGNSVCINGANAGSNTITIDSSFQNNDKIILKDVNISTPKSGIKVSEGANVEFVLKGNNSVTSTSCKKNTDYAAIEVPSDATATFSGDGTLTATAQGYGAAIGTNGYYRDGLDHADNDKSSGVVNIKGATHVVATSAYGAGIGGGAISGSSCKQNAFDNGEVYISEDAVVEASCTDGYSAGIGGGGCYTSTCEATAGDGGIIEVSGNAQVTAKCSGLLGAGIGGGGACAKTCNSYAGDAKYFVSNDNAVVNAYGADYAPGIGGGGAQQKTCCATYCGDGGDVILQGNTVVTADGGKDAAGVGPGKHTGGGKNHPGSASTTHKAKSATLNSL